MNRTRSPDQQHETATQEVAEQKKTTAAHQPSQGNAYLQQQIAEQSEASSSTKADPGQNSENGQNPWNNASWVKTEQAQENTTSTEARVDAGAQTPAAPGAGANISEEQSAEAPKDTEMELPGEAGLDEDGGHSSDDPGNGSEAPPPTESAGAPPPPVAPPTEGGAPADNESATAAAPADIGSTSIDLNSIAGPAPTLASAPTTSGGGAVSDFINQNSSKVSIFIDGAASMQAQILAATEVSAASIDAAIARGKNEVDRAIEAARNLADTDLESAHTHVDTEASRARASVESSVLTAQETVQLAHSEAEARLQASASAQVAQIESTYGSWQSRFDAIGPAVGDEATQLGATRAATWRGQKNGESSLLDGPIHDNKMEARAEAAESVGAQYRQSLIDSATERAQAIQDGKARDLDGITATLNSSSTLLQNQLTGSKTGMDGSRKAALARVEQTRLQLHDAIDQQHGGRRVELDALQGSRYEQLDVYGGAQRDAVIEAGAEAADTVSEEATQAGNAMMNTLHEINSATPAQEAPLSTDTLNALDNANDQFDAILGTASAQLQESTNLSEDGVRQSGMDIDSALSTLTNENASGVKTGGQSASQAFGSFQSSATDAYDQVLSAHEDSLGQGLNASKEGFGEVSEGIDGQFQEMNQALEQGFGEGAQGLEEGLRASLQDEDRDISKYAEEAAGRVQPRWKSVLKVVLVIAVIVAVCLVAGPLAAGLGAIGLSGLGAAVAAGTILGAAAGATIQMSHNLVDGNAIMDGVGKAAIMGAIGGAFGGLGAGLAAGVSSVAGRIGVEFGLDALGGVLGELAVGNAPTLEGILIGVGIGAGVGVGMRGVSAIQPKIRPDVSGPSSIDIGTPAVRAEAPTPKTTEAPVTTARAEAPTAKTSTETPTPRSEPQTRTKKSVETQTVEFRTQVEAKYGPEGAEAFDRLAAVTRNPKQARDTLRYADSLGYFIPATHMTTIAAQL